MLLADIGPGRLELAEVARFANDPVSLWNGQRSILHWDLPGLFCGVCAGIAEAGRSAENLLGIGVDSRAVDYGLLRDGALLALPHHYRDSRTAGGVEAVHSLVEPEELYRRNGLHLGLADRALLIPDLIGYWLTGRHVTERTNASTTGLLGIDGQWDSDLSRRSSTPDTRWGRCCPRSPTGSGCPG